MLNQQHVCPRWARPHLRHRLPPFPLSRSPPARCAPRRRARRLPQWHVQCGHSRRVHTHHVAVTHAAPAVPQRSVRQRWHNLEDLVVLAWVDEFAGLGIDYLRPGGGTVPALLLLGSYTDSS
eukprot:358274-Chlamydomonas_euryale.AAC.2